MTGPLERPWWHGGGWGLMLGSSGLAVAAVVVLALGGEDTRLLRLGIVAALWAALLGTFATARMRREIGTSTDRVEDLRTVYHLQLEREIAARREHELIVERELREQVEESQRADIAAMRAELHSLRGTLQHLLGGDVLVERVALRESTRLRPLPEPEHPRAVSAADPVSRAPRGVTVSGWPGSEPPLMPAPAGHTRAESLLPHRHTPYSTEQPGYSAEQPGEEGPRGRRRTEAERARDTGSADRSWSPAVSWTPSMVDSAEPATGDGHGRRRRAEPDRSGGPGVGSRSTERHVGGSAGSYGTPVSPVSPASPSPVSPQPRSNDNGSRAQAHQAQARPAQVQSVGAHRGGRSVHELLAAYGDYGENPTPRHRRRRKDDHSL